MKMPHPHLILAPDYLIQEFDINIHTEWLTVHIKISYLLQKPTDLDLHCLQRQSIYDSAGQGLKSKSLSEGAWCAGRQTGSHKSCIVCKKNIET